MFTDYRRFNGSTKSPKFLRAPHGASAHPARDRASRRTQRALVTSALSLLLCSSMLVGTTFAWFQQSVRITSSTIQPGHLAADFSYWDGEQYVPLDPDTTAIFKDVSWEPGTTKALYLRIANRGGMDFTYKAGLDVAENTLGVNLDGKEIDMTKLLRFALLTPTDDVSLNPQDPNGTYDLDDLQVRQALRAQCELFVEEAHTSVLRSTLPAPAPDAQDPSYAYFALVVSLPPEVGFEANHDGAPEHQPKVQLALTLTAIQSTAEYDLAVTDPAAFAGVLAAAQAGDTVALFTDVTLDAPVAVTRDVTIQTMGHTITVNGGFSAFAVAEDVRLTILGGALVHPVTVPESEPQPGQTLPPAPAAFAGEGTVALSGTTLTGWLSDDAAAYPAE